MTNTISVWLYSQHKR